MALQAAGALAQISKACESLATALAEVRQYRKAIEQETAPLDYARFCEEVRYDDPRLADALCAARPARFALGVLTLCVPDGTNYALLSIHKQILTERLTNRYEVPFSIKIRQQE